MPSPKFSENFWGDKDDGFDVLLTRMRQGKATCKELIEVISARAAIEEEYSKKLLRLSKSIVGKDETGTLKDSLNVFKTELEQTAQSHANLANELRTKVEKGLVDFMLEQSNTRKAQAKLMEKTLKTKVAQAAHVQRTKQNFEKKIKELEQLQQQETKGGGLPPKEAEKLSKKVKTATQASEEADKEFRSSVDKMKQVAAQWQTEMVETSELFQKLEEQRIDFLRTSLWTYSNVLSTGCVADDESCERLRGSLEKCNVENDITVFVNERATGKNIPEVIDYETTRSSIVSGLAMPISSSPPVSMAMSNQGATFGGGGGFARSQIIADDDDDDRPKLKPVALPSSVPGCIFQVRVLYDYDPQGQEELQLREGDIVAVVSDQEDPWWEGEINGKRGMFPSNFVEKL